MGPMGQAGRSWGRRGAGEPPLVIGHRGASARELENTVEAFARAMADGADGVELDVLLCGSGDVVVFHDDDLRRLGGRPERIRDLSFAALRELRLTGGGRIPTLEEAIEACGPGALVNVELKIRGIVDRAMGALVDRVAAIVDRSGAAPRILVSSFSPLAVAAWRLRRPDVRAALLFEAAAPRPLRGAWGLPLLRPHAVHPEHVLCTGPAIAAWHAAGYVVNTWTVDDPAGLRRLSDAGIDGLVTNDPAVARRALGLAAQ